MKKSIDLKIYENKEALGETLELLIDEAVRQLDYAYAPYSNFHVGAAALLNNGKILGGSNQENASYPLCMCGERVALYHAASTFPNEKIKAVAITARNAKMKLLKPVMPCGACRQVLTEYEQRHQQNIMVLLRTDDGKVYQCESASELLPFGFDQSFLF